MIDAPEHVAERIYQAGFFEDQWDNEYYGCLWVLGDLLNQLEKKRRGVEREIVVDNGLLPPGESDKELFRYQSSTALSDKIDLRHRELTSIFSKDPDWRCLTRCLKDGRCLKDEVIAGLFEVHPPDKDTKRAKVIAIGKTEFHIWGHSRAIAGLTETRSEYVTSIWNNRGGQAEPSEFKKDGVKARDSYRCVKCNQTPEQGEIHHIVPPREGGGSDERNLAYLCKECHLEAHDGHFMNAPIHDTVDEFWGWANRKHPYE